MTEQVEPQVLSVPEAGRLLGICRDSAYAAVRTGALPSIRLGKRIVVPRAALERLLSGNSRQPPSEKNDNPRPR